MRLFVAFQIRVLDLKIQDCKESLETRSAHFRSEIYNLNQAQNTLSKTPGPKGDKGAQGDSGSNGSKGMKGETGALGQSGQKGEKGLLKYFLGKF